MVLHIENLIVRYRAPNGQTVTALHLPSLQAEAGQVVTVAGRSGSGKTTLLNAIAGLITPSAGSVRVLDQTVSLLTEPERDRFRARSIGYVHQAFNLLPGFTALENVALAMAFAGDRSRHQQKERAADLLKRVGLGERLHHRPGQMSGGEQQRVAIARALANDPKVILVDEPTANLDEQTAAQVIDLLYAVPGATVIMATHDPALLEKASHLLRLAPPGEETSTDAAD